MLRRPYGHGDTAVQIANCLVLRKYNYFNCMTSWTSTLPSKIVVSSNVEYYTYCLSALDFRLIESSPKCEGGIYKHIWEVVNSRMAAIFI